MSFMYIFKFLTRVLWTRISRTFTKVRYLTKAKSSEAFGTFDIVGFCDEICVFGSSFFFCRGFGVVHSVISTLSGGFLLIRVCPLVAIAGTTILVHHYEIS